MLRQPLIILDLETTGMLAAEERITEIGLIEVDNGEFVDSWSQLVNPEKSIPPFIESITGISDAMVRHAPTFAELAPALYARLQGKLLVAHNARFDYGFLRSEFGRVDLAYEARVLCTVKLSRKLFPEQRRHNLDSLIQRHDLSCSARHRALGDAEVLWQFLQKIQAKVDAERVAAALLAQLDAPGMPAGSAPATLEPG
jgi:DNA polymerase-3 subunit epsilon